MKNASRLQNCGYVTLLRSLHKFGGILGAGKMIRYKRNLNSGMRVKSSLAEVGFAHFCSCGIVLNQKKHVTIDTRRYAFISWRDRDKQSECSGIEPKVVAGCGMLNPEHYPRTVCVHYIVSFLLIHNLPSSNKRNHECDGAWVSDRN